MKENYKMYAQNLTSETCALIQYKFLKIFCHSPMLKSIKNNIIITIGYYKCQDLNNIQ